MKQKKIEKSIHRKDGNGLVTWYRFFCLTRFLIADMVIIVDAEEVIYSWIKTSGRCHTAILTIFKENISCAFGV